MTAMEDRNTAFHSNKIHLHLDALGSLYPPILSIFIQLDRCHNARVSKITQRHAYDDEVVGHINFTSLSFKTYMYITKKMSF